jgi:hypothetical protein
VAGLIPGLGIVPDLLDALFYLAEGDLSNVAIAGLAALPLLGQGVRAAWLARKADDIYDVGKTATRWAKGRIPWQYGETLGALGTTDKFGNITIKPGLSGRELIETVRHEGVHRFFSPKSGPLKELRADIGMAAYRRSHLVRYAEEAIAETIGTGSLRRGLALPLHGYGISTTRLATEAVGYIGITAGAAYGSYQWASSGG